MGDDYQPRAGTAAAGTLTGTTLAANVTSAPGITGTAQNWTGPQTITVSGANDGLVIAAPGGVTGKAIHCTLNGNDVFVVDLAGQVIVDSGFSVVSAAGLFVDPANFTGFSSDSSAGMYFQTGAGASTYWQLDMYGNWSAGQASSIDTNSGTIIAKHALTATVAAFSIGGTDYYPHVAAGVLTFTSTP